MVYICRYLKQNVLLAGVFLQQIKQAATHEFISSLIIKEINKLYTTGTFVHIL